MNLSQPIALAAVVIIAVLLLAIQMVELMTHTDPLGRSNVRGNIKVYVFGLMGVAIFWTLSMVHQISDPANVWQIGAFSMACVDLLIGVLSLLHVGIWVQDHQLALKMNALASEITPTP